MNRSPGSTITADLLTLIGPEEVTKLTRPLTADEDRLIADALAKHGSHSAALGVQDPQLAAEIDALFSR